MSPINFTRSASCAKRQNNLRFPTEVWINKGLNLEIKPQ